MSLHGKNRRSQLECQAAISTKKKIAPDLAFENSKIEFDRVCAASDDCRNYKVQADPKRTMCKKTPDGFRCHRLINFEISESLTDEAKSKLTAKTPRISHQKFISLTRERFGNLRARFRNDPKRSPKGTRVHVRIRFTDGENSLDGGIIEKMVLYEAEEWLSARGYEIVPKIHPANLVVALAFLEKKVSAERTDRRLLFEVYQQSYGYKPELLTEGVVIPTMYNQAFLHDQRNIGRIVGLGLSKSILGTIERAPASIETPKPQDCWPMLGLSFDQSDHANKYTIVGFHPKSTAPSAGLRIGDRILSIGTQVLGTDSNDTPPLSEGDVVTVTGIRSGKSFSKKVKARILCLQGQ